MSKEPTKKPEKKKRRFFKKGDQVYFSAFTKQDKETFYMCRGTIKKIPSENERQVFKVKILSVGNAPIGGEPKQNLPQCSLLNRTITKKFKELHKDVSQFMKPVGWIEVVPSK